MLCSLVNSIPTSLSCPSKNYSQLVVLCEMPIQCTIDILPTGTDIDGTDATATLMNNVCQ